MYEYEYMEEAINIEETEDEPKVVLDKINNVFEISGRSLPEDTTKFYNPIREWVEKYVKYPNLVTEFLFKLEYFNSSSAKQIVNILVNLEQIHKTGKEIKVIWYYNKNDELMEARGKEIGGVVDIPFELRTY